MYTDFHECVWDTIFLIKILVHIQYVDHKGRISD